MPRKRTKPVKPSLDEVKEQPGSFVIATIDGVAGPHSIQAPRRRRLADVELQDLVILPYEPQVIDPEWLDVPLFRQAYTNFTEIKVYKADELPQKPKLYDLPPEIERSLTSFLRNKAYEVATASFGEVSKKLIWARNDTLVTQRAISDWETTELLPFLKAIQVYENRFGKRKEVLDEVAKRLKDAQKNRELVLGI